MGMVPPLWIHIASPLLLRDLFRHLARSPSNSRRRSLFDQVQEGLGNLQEVGSFEVSLSPFFARWEEECAAFKERRGGGTREISKLPSHSKVTDSLSSLSALGSSPISTKHHSLYP